MLVVELMITTVGAYDASLLILFNSSIEKDRGFEYWNFFIWKYKKMLIEL